MIVKYPSRRWAFMHWMDVAWSWRITQPTASCVVTGLWGVVGLLAGIVVAISNSIGAGILLILIGAVLLGLVIYAGYDTDWFQDKEKLVKGHRLARGIGPLSVSTTVLASVVFLGFFVLFMKIMDYILHNWT